MSGVLAVMAHPDDAELWAGGTLAGYTSDGCEVTIAVRRSDDVRNAEALAGAAVLDAHLRLFDQVDDLLVRCRPEIVITQSLLTKGLVAGAGTGGALAGAVFE